MKLNNKYYMLRHGEAISNVKNIVSSWPEKFANHLVKEGNEKVRKSAEGLRGKNINFIFASDLARTKETAEIASAILGVKIEYDKRLRELDFGDFNSKSAEKFEGYFKNSLERIEKSVPGGESYNDVRKRAADFFEEINKKFQGKNILIVSHQCPLFLLEGYARGFSLKETIENFSHEKMQFPGELRELTNQK